METTVATLTPYELETLVERAIDRRMNVWFTQMLDALYMAPNEPDEAMRPEFIAALQRSQAQAEAGDVLDLDTFRAQLEA